jgi:non-heme chloroperoxidase
VLASIDVPALVMHGTADEVVDLQAAEYAAGLIPNAQTRWYDGVGRMPFAERVKYFTADLVTFTHSALTTKAGS